MNQPKNHLSKFILVIVSLLSVNLTAANALGIQKTTPQAAAAIRDKWAVLVGVGEYQDTVIPPVRLATKNVADLSKLLQDPAIGRFAREHVMSLTGTQATKQNIEDTINNSWLVKKALPNDLVMLYFCTRITPSADQQDLLLCPYDTSVTQPEQQGISLKQLLSELKMRSQSQRILCILDSQVLQNGQVTATNLLKDISTASGVSIWSAGQPSQNSAESGANSIFTQYLLEGIKTGGGLLPLSMVTQYVEQNVPVAVSKLSGETQSPIFVLAPGSNDLVNAALGIAVKSSLPPQQFAIGHPANQLPLTRPDLSRRKSSTTTTSVEDDDDDDTPAEGVDFSTYMSNMKKHIQSKWTPPKGFENRSVTAVFTILRNGTIVNPTLTQASGIDNIDKAALAALQSASPLPPLPLGAPKSVQVQYKFDWKVSHSFGQ